MADVAPDTTTRSNSTDELGDGNLFALLLGNTEDLIIGSEGDALIATNLEASVQRFITFIHTRKYTHKLYPNFGSRVTNILGKTLTLSLMETAKQELIEDMVQQDITFVPGSVDVLPLSDNAVIITVTIRDTLDGSSTYGQTSIQTSTHSTESDEIQDSGGYTQ